MKRAFSGPLIFKSSLCSVAGPFGDAAGVCVKQCFADLASTAAETQHLFEGIEKLLSQPESPLLRALHRKWNSGQSRSV